MTVEPPAESDLFDETVTVVEGDFDREYWIEHATQFLGLEQEIAEERRTEWIVGWVNEHDNRYY
jgi:hypothetical protein